MPMEARTLSWKTQLYQNRRNDPLFLLQEYHFHSPLVLLCVLLLLLRIKYL